MIIVNRLSFFKNYRIFSWYRLSETRSPDDTLSIKRVHLIWSYSCWKIRAGNHSRAIDCFHHVSSIYSTVIFFHLETFPLSHGILKHHSHHNSCVNQWEIIRGLCIIIGSITGAWGYAAIGREASKNAWSLYQSWGAETKTQLNSLYASRKTFQSFSQSTVSLISTSSHDILSISSHKKTMIHHKKNLCFFLFFCPIFDMRETFCQLLRPRREQMINITISIPQLFLCFEQDWSKFFYLLLDVDERFSDFSWSTMNRNCTKTKLQTRQ